MPQLTKAARFIKVEIPAEWANMTVAKEKHNGNVPEFISNVMEPINAMKGDDLPVSAFHGQGRWYFPVRHISI